MGPPPQVGVTLADGGPSVDAPVTIGDTPNLPVIDVSERAGHHTGDARSLNRRLFMQLLVFDCGRDTEPDTAIARLSGALVRGEHPAVIYRDLNHPRGMGLLTWSEDPGDFVTKVHDTLLSNVPGLQLRPEFTMMGRTYAIGYEPDLEYWLLKRPVEQVLRPDSPWAMWYPLRRTETFEGLPAKQQAGMLREHAAIGRAYGKQGFAHDVRLACHGLDASDNGFVIGLMGKELHPLSHLIQRMRRSQQTSQYIARTGPFFVGHVAWRRARAPDPD